MGHREEALPQYDHAAVIVAEDITSRFLNVISLFNGAVPLIAIQMRAVQLGDSVSLLFTTVVDQVQRGLVGEDEDIHEATDRSYWEARGSKSTVAMADDLMEILRSIDSALELKYNKFYIGLARKGQADNFVIFRPQKSSIRIEPRLKKTEAIDQRIESTGLDVLDYDNRWSRYKIRLGIGEVKMHTQILRELFELAHKEFSGGSED